jgi:protein TonB
MAYADQKLSSGKIVAMVIVALIHVALGYAFVTGLATDFVKKANEKLDVFDVEPPPPPPPPEEPPPPPPDQPNLPPPPTQIVAPPSIVPNNAAPVFQTTSVIPPSPPPVAPPAPPAPPPPAPPRVSQAAGLKGNPAQFFGADAYPPAAQRAEAQGRVVASLTVGTDGRVSDCTVTTSSGNSDLDSTTCRIARSRVRFTPAKDDAGNPMTSKYTLPVRWVLPDS